MDSIFSIADALGPAKVVYIHDAHNGLNAVVVVDNVAAGPSMGGTRMASDVSAQECFRLARAMTLKNAAAGLAHGGGKSVIFGDPEMADDSKEILMRAFARAIADIHDYIPGPDMGTNERCMAWVKDEIGRAVGLPTELGGIPLDEIGATGFGLMVAIEEAARRRGLQLDGARIAVQGFGSVGRHAARFLAEQGCVLVAAADSRGCLINASGIDVKELAEITEAGGTVIDSAQGDVRERDAIIAVPCEIWIPAARPDVIRMDNVEKLQTQLVAQGANIAVTEEAEARLHARGIISLPDFIANAGGVICAAVEYNAGTRQQAFDTIEETIRHNIATVLSNCERDHSTPRAAAVALAEARVRRAMAYRR